MTAFATYGSAGIRAPSDAEVNPALGIGNTSFPSASSAGRTTVGLPWRFWITTERLPSTWPLALNLMGPPKETRSVAGMFVWRIASASALRIGAASRA